MRRSQARRVGLAKRAATLCVLKDPPSICAAAAAASHRHTRVSYLASTPSSKPLQMVFIPGVPTYRTAAAAYEQREVQAKGVRAGTARSCLWVGRDASLRRPDAMLSGPRVAPALLDPLADRDQEGVVFGEKYWAPWSH